MFLHKFTHDHSPFTIRKKRDENMKTEGGSKEKQSNCIKAAVMTCFVSLVFFKSLNNLKTNSLFQISSHKSSVSKRQFW